MSIRRTLIALLLLLIGTGCSQPESMMNPGGPAGQNLTTVGWVVFIVLGITAVIMWVLLLWASVRRRGTLAEHLPWNEGGGQLWIFIGGFAIPFVVLCGLFVFAMDRMGQFPLNGGTNVHPEIRVIGHQWWWEVHYLSGGPDQHFITANEIHIPVGKPIDIVLETADVIHSFWIPALHGKMEMIPGQPNYLRIEASRPGNFFGECGEYCGEQHAHMRLLVVAQSPAQYEAWRQQQLKPAAEPQDPEAMHGRDVFVNGPCAMCHTVRGTQALGRVAPDLTHLAGRQYIGANTFRNNKGNLGGWVTHAQTMKPGCLMPDLTQFNGPDLRALVDYLMELK